tara:strand:+ start:4064 stop:4606 length:543 start_codon:yes stop_codon:yes gene_type:complete
MNIFVLDENPITAARMYCDKHSPKMVVELLQQLGSAVIRHGATPEQMPLTSKGTPLKGGYHNHPCTIWCGESQANFIWASIHAIELCLEFTRRFGKTHFCEKGIRHLANMYTLIPSGGLTDFARAFDLQNPDLAHLYDEDKYTAVEAYREFYHTKRFSNGLPKWEHSVTPSWWQGVEVTA